MTRRGRRRSSSKLTSTKNARTAAISSTKLPVTVRLGTTLEPSLPMTRRDTSAKIAGAMKMPSECLTTGSRRKSPTSRGVYWLAPN